MLGAVNVAMAWRLRFHGLLIAADWASIEISSRYVDVFTMQGAAYLSCELWRNMVTFSRH